MESVKPNVEVISIADRCYRVMVNGIVLCRFTLNHFGELSIVIYPSRRGVVPEIVTFGRK